MGPKDRPLNGLAGSELGHHMGLKTNPVIYYNGSSKVYHWIWKWTLAYGKSRGSELNMKKRLGHNYREMDLTLDPNRIKVESMLRVLDRGVSS